MLIDQFITTSEKKWARTSGFVTMIPYTTEQRSINMNTYMDRLLSMCSDDFNYYVNHESEWVDIDKNENFKVCNVTSPKNYFHLLRSQVTNNYRKPLFLYTNETVMLKTQSKVKDFVGETKFEKVIDDQVTDKNGVKKIVFCTGKFYFDLLDKKTSDEVALVRLEQVGPFPY